MKRKIIVFFVLASLAIITLVQINITKDSVVSLSWRNIEALALGEGGGDVPSGSRVDCYEYIQRDRENNYPTKQQFKRQCSDCVMYLDVIKADYVRTCVINY